MLDVDVHKGEGVSQMQTKADEGEVWKKQVFCMDFLYGQPLMTEDF